MGICLILKTQLKARSANYPSMGLHRKVHGSVLCVENEFDKIIQLIEHPVTQSLFTVDIKIQTGKISDNESSECHI